MNLEDDKRAEDAAEQLQPIARNSVCDAIVDQIVNLISRSLLKPGDRLPSERDLCKRFGVGRTSVREALRSLTAMGIVDGRVGDGTFVADNRRHLERTVRWGMLLDGSDVESLVETRLMLESNTALWAASRAQDENLVAIETHMEGMRGSAGDADRFLEFDIGFHLEIANATQNPILARLVSTTRGYLQEWIRGSLRTAPGGAVERARLSVSQHEAILAALRSRQPEGARQAMEAHILSSSQDLRALT